MIRDNMAFDDALKTAQELGYAEHIFIGKSTFII